MEAILPPELWGVIVSHVESGDFRTVDAIRMLCRSVNKIIRLYLSDVIRIGGDGKSHQVLRNGVEHGTAQHEGGLGGMNGTFIVVDTYYWGVKHGRHYKNHKWDYVFGRRVFEECKCHLFGTRHGLWWYKYEYEDSDVIDLSIREYENDRVVCHREYMYNYGDKFAISAYEYYRSKSDEPLTTIDFCTRKDNIEQFIIEVPLIDYNGLGIEKEGYK
jgi:hypothetical protein